MTWNSLEVQWLGLSPSTEGGTGLVPVRFCKLKIRLAMWQDQKELN